MPLHIAHGPFLEARPRRPITDVRRTRKWFSGGITRTPLLHHILSPEVIPREHGLSKTTQPRATGRMTRKRVPWPGMLSTSSRPPWSWTMPWVMLRPSPVPSPTPLVVKNGSKIWGRTSSGMPQPLSATSTMTSPSMRRRW